MTITEIYTLTPSLNDKKQKFAVWVLTSNGKLLADIISDHLPDVCVNVSQNIGTTNSDHQTFQNLAASVRQQFQRYTGHIFIMSTGIVVRLIAPLIKHKTEDPAVVVVDDGGNHAISLLSGHLGGANDLTRRIADVIGARPVITTATDVNHLPAIDVLAKEKKLFIENPATIKIVNMALLNGARIDLHDPFDILQDSLPNANPRNLRELNNPLTEDHPGSEITKNPGVFIDDVIVDLPSRVLILRPLSLVAGIGCNRNTPSAEIKNLLKEVLAAGNLAAASLKFLASIDVKADEEGLIALGNDLDLPLVFFQTPGIKPG